MDALPPTLSLLTSFSFGVSTVLIKDLLNRGARPFEATYLTVALQAATLALLYIILYPLGLESIPRPPDIPYFLVAGIVAPGLARLFMYSSVDRTSAAAGHALGNSAPLFTVPMGIFFLHEEVGVGKGIGAALVVLGIVLVGLGKGSFDTRSVGYGLVSAILYATSYTLRKLGIGGTTPIVGALITVTASMLVLLPIGGRSGVMRVVAVARGYKALVAGVSSGLGWASMFKALELGDLVTVTTLSSLGPLFTLLLSYMAKIDRITLRQSIGVLFSVLGTSVLSLAR